ncbi:MAG: hypothetical protein Tsb0020_23940 [Haliangiales bacterium]
MAIFAIGLLGCSTAPTGVANYAATAQQNYNKGLAELEEKDWIAAAKYFSFVKARFPYSKYAVLAELRIADAEFGAEHYLQAIDNYKLFTRFHPTHRMVTNGYAPFRVGESYMKMLPDDMWILPPSYEKDQSASYDAERELRTFIKKYPDSTYRERAEEMLVEIHTRLAAHEWYVAEFYWKRDKPMGAVLRLRRLLDRYAGTRYDGDALWLLGQAYVEVKMPARARQAWQRLIDEHPDHARIDDARNSLANLPAGAQPAEQPADDQLPLAPAADEQPPAATSPAAASPAATPPAATPPSAAPEAADESAGDGSE